RVRDDLGGHRLVDLVGELQRLAAERPSARSKPSCDLTDLVLVWLLKRDLLDCRADVTDPNLLGLFGRELSDDLFVVVVRQRATKQRDEREAVFRGDPLRVAGAQPAQN